MSESLVDKWRKIPLGAGAVVAGMCADELAEELGALVQRLRMYAERSENADWSDGINRAADELTEWLAARGINERDALERIKHDGRAQ